MMITKGLSMKAKIDGKENTAYLYTVTEGGVTSLKIKSEDGREFEIANSIKPVLTHSERVERLADEFASPIDDMKDRGLGQVGRGVLIEVFDLAIAYVDDPRNDWTYQDFLALVKSEFSKPGAVKE